MASYPPPIQKIINSGHVPVIKATRTGLNINYDIANNLLQRIMHRVYGRAVQVVLDRAPNFQGDITIEQIEQVHKYMYDYLGHALSIPLDVIMGLRDPYEAGKVARQELLIEQLFGSIDAVERLTAFSDVVGIEHPENLRVRFGPFYPGSELRAIFLENMYVVANAPLDAVQYHMTIGPVIERDGMAQGYHMTNYFYADPHGLHRTYYRNDGTVLEDIAAARAESVRRKQASNAIKASVAASKGPLTPKRQRAQNIAALLMNRGGLEVSGVEKKLRTETAASAVSSSESDVIDHTKYTMENKPKVRAINGIPTLIVRLLNKAGKEVAIYTLGNLVHYGIGTYSADVLNDDNLPLRGRKGRKYTISFDDTAIPTANRHLLDGAQEVPCAAAAAGGGGGGGAAAACITPQGEPLAKYILRENFSHTDLGTALYNLLIAYFSNIMKTSPIKLNVNSELFELVELLTSPLSIRDALLSPEYPRLSNILDKYGLLRPMLIFRDIVTKIQDDARLLPTPLEQHDYIESEYDKLSEKYPQIPIEHLDRVLDETYVTDPDIHFNPPLYTVILEIRDLKEKHDLSKMSVTRLQNLLDKILDKIRDAARLTPDNHSSIKVFKKEIIEGSPIGPVYIAKYGPFKGKQGGGKRKTLKRRSRRTRKAN